MQLLPREDTHHNLIERGGKRRADAPASNPLLIEVCWLGLVVAATVDVAISDGAAFHSDGCESAPQMFRSGAPVWRQVLLEPLAPRVVSSEVSLHAAVSSARACGRGEWPLPFLGLSFRRVSRNDDAASFHGKRPRVAFSSLRL